MDIQSTKTMPEREDEEAERLVRSDPKYKPPRRDRRRERMDTDPDEEQDPDLSKNYKDIGGSVGVVLLRWAKKKNIPVINVETGEPVPGGVSPKTLRKFPGKYKPLDVPEGTPNKDKSKKDKSKKDKEPGPEEGKSEEGAPDQPDETQIAVEWVATKKHEAPEFLKFLDALPTGDIDPVSGQSLVLDPKTRKRVPFDQVGPEAQVSLIKRFTAQQEEKTKAEKLIKKKESQRKAAKEASDRLGRLPPEVQDALGAIDDPNSEVGAKLKALKKEGYQPDDIRIEKLIPELKGKLPDGLDSFGDAQKLLVLANTYDSMSEADKANVGEPPRRPVSEAEKKETLKYLMDSLPPEVATSMFSRGIHPDDAKELVDSYKAAKLNPIKNPSEFASVISGVYTDDPDRVPPPKEWKGKPFESLSSDDKANALRQRQMQVLAVSLAAKENLTKALEGRSFLGGPAIPTVLASALADNMLTKKKGTETARKREAQQAAQVMFDTMMSEGRHFPIRDKAITELMGKLDPASQEVARGFFEANDYFAAKKKFLKGGATGTEDNLSERSSPKDILKGMEKAKEFMKERAALYGGGNVAQQFFRTRVMDRLRTLAPEKYTKVQAKLDEADARDYEWEHYEWKKKHEAWERRRDKVDHLNREPYREQAFNEPEPVEPVKPLRYEDSKGARKKKDSLWKSIFGENRTASRVADRYTSIYSGGLTMEPNHKRAVYHGVEPDKAQPYPEWGQAHQRDLGESDFQKILDVARSWLGSAVLTENMDGAVPDAKLRAALDYAIQTSPYQRAINPTLYNQLLARLAKVPQPGPGNTLLTIRGTAQQRGSTCENPTSRRQAAMAVKTAEQSKYASNILGRLDKLAQDIQEHHASWGMSMGQAKSVVNHLDAVADDFEKLAFGEASLQKRQHEVLAAVIQRDTDEAYMDNFQSPTQPIQTDADEPYMSAYNDDQTSAVGRGKATDGRPLAP